MDVDFFHSVLYEKKPLTYTRKYLFLFYSALLTMFLSGCSFLSPSAETELKFRPDIPAQFIYSCIEEAIKKLRAENAFWDQEYNPHPDITNEYEAKYFRKINIVGIFLRARYLQHNGILEIKTIARGAYFADIGAQSSADQAKSKIQDCVENKNPRSTQ